MQSGQSHKCELKERGKMRASVLLRGPDCGNFQWRYIRKVLRCFLFVLCGNMVETAVIQQEAAHAQFGRCGEENAGTLAANPAPFVRCPDCAVRATHII